LKDCDERKKENVSHHHHHLRRLTTERRTIKKNFRGGYIINFIKQNYTDFEEERLREKKGI
jgi:hypothetical protein